MPKPRDPLTKEMFPAAPIQVAPVKALPATVEIIPPAKKPRTHKKKPAQQSVPNIPLPAARFEPIPEAKPAPAIAASAPPDLTLFPYPYFFLLGAAWAMILIVANDNLYNTDFAASIIKGYTYFAGKLSLYQLALIRLAISALISIFTLLCGIHICVRPTRLPLARWLGGFLFITTALGLAALALYCEFHFANVGLDDANRRFTNMRNMQWPKP